MYFESIFRPLAFPSHSGLKIFGRKVWQLSHMELTWMTARNFDENMTRVHSHSHTSAHSWQCCRRDIGDTNECKMTKNGFEPFAPIPLLCDVNSLDGAVCSVRNLHRFCRRRQFHFIVSLLRRIYFSCDVYAIHNSHGRYTVVEQYRLFEMKKISTHNESKDIHAPLRLDGFTSWLCLGVLVCCKLNGERKNKTAMWIKQTGINLEVVPWLCNNPTKSTRILIGQPLGVSAGTLSVGSENKTSLLTFHL